MTSSPLSSTTSKIRSPLQTGQARISIRFFFIKIHLQRWFCYRRKHNSSLYQGKSNSFQLSLSHFPVDLILTKYLVFNSSYYFNVIYALWKLVIWIFTILSMIMILLIRFFISFDFPSFHMTTSIHFQSFSMIHKNKTHLYIVISFF